MNLHSSNCGPTVLSECSWCLFKMAFKHACSTYGVVLCILAGFTWSSHMWVSIVLGTLGLSACVYSSWRPRKGRSA